MKKLSVWSPRPDALPIETLSPCVTLYGLPMLTITPLQLDKPQIQAVLSADALFYVSQYAVTALFEQVAVSALKDKIHIAIGEKTAKTLINHEIYPTLTAKPPFNSEALLTDRDFQALSFSSLALVSGQSGRQLLEKNLRQQGKKVMRIITYQRDKCHVNSQTMVKFLHDYAINAVLLTSCEVVDAVATQLQRGGNHDFYRLPAFALSQRIADYAKLLGFTQVIVADYANRSALYDKMSAWCD